METPFGFWNILFDIVLLLGVGMIFGAFCVRLRQSPLVGYILAGMLLGGPGSFGLLTSNEEVSAIAELGVTLLLFELGLEFSLKHFRSLGMRVVYGGCAQIAGTLAVGAAACWLLGRGPREALTIGLLIAFSSTAAVVRMLNDSREMESPHGRTAVGVLLVQDAAVVPAAILLAVLGSAQSGAAIGQELLRIGVLAVLFILGLYLVVRKSAVSFLRSLHLEQNRELTVLLAITTGLGSAWTAHAIGISPALGAFAAGLFLAETPFALQIRADVAPLQVLLLTLFFGSIGILADSTWMIANWERVAGAALLILAAKTVITFLGLSLAGIHRTTALAAALSVSQIGEFSFVLGKTAQAAGLIPQEAFSLVLSAAIVLLLITPFLVRRAATVSALITGSGKGETGPLEAEPVRAADAAAPSAAIIIGFGPVGQAAGQVLAAHKVSTCVIDLSQRLLALAKESGFRTLLGDARQEETLTAAKTAQACIIVITVPAPLAALRIVERARVMAPHAFLYVRARHARHSEALRASGVHMLVDEEQCAGDKIAEALQETLRPRMGQ
jgi:monovalent cation:H+ antiporter-2, CPA2 family